MVYLPMAYLYGKKFIGPITPTIMALREEIYDEPYHNIDWGQSRNACAKVCSVFKKIQKVLAWFFIVFLNEIERGEIPLPLILY